MELKMAAKTEGAAQEIATQIHGPTCMESVNRIAQFPVVESTIQTATSLYSKVKEYNSVTQWTFATTEQAVNKAVEVGKPIASPVVKGLEGPIRKVDSVLCSGLDYVEAKVPAVKMPAGEILLQVYSSTKDLVESTMVGAKAYVEPTVNAALHSVEPVFERTRQVVEPLVAPVLQGALHGAEQVRERVGEYLHNHQHQANNDGEIECKDCNKAKKQ